MNNKFGLATADIQVIKDVIAGYPQVDKAIMFGSRAKGNYKPGSDVDMALKGTAISLEDVLRISYILNQETKLPYHFDVLNYNTIKEHDLISHIDRVGIVFYDKALLSK